MFKVYIKLLPVVPFCSFNLNDKKSKSNNNNILLLKCICQGAVSVSATWRPAGKQTVPLRRLLKSSSVEFG